MKGMTLDDVAAWLRDKKKQIVVLYAFNATGKTRLSVAFKELMRDNKGHQTGIYYNAFSEDLFAWDNDMKHAEKEMRLSYLGIPLLNTNLTNNSNINLSRTRNF